MTQALPYVIAGAQITQGISAKNDSLIGGIAGGARTAIEYKMFG
jgi:hypothetical protein